MNHLEHPSHHPGAASRIFGDEAVIISPAENMVRMLNPTGARIWQLIDGARTPEEIAAILSEEFAVDPVEALDSVAAFLEELSAKNLITWK